VAGPMTYNDLSDQLCDPSVNMATFTWLLKTHFSSYWHVWHNKGAECIELYKLMLLTYVLAR